jgi:hypothetical protein
MKSPLLLLPVLGIAMLASCNNEAGPTGDRATGDSVATAPRPGVAIADVSPSPEFQGATLTMSSAKAAKAGNDSAKVSFAFGVKNYELKSQTTDNANKMCSNSAQGQHIHFILDDMPYKALYEPNNDVVLANNTEHYLLAFLSRSYHESVKSPGAAILYHFKIDEKGNLKKLDDPKTPMVFYSRPKGDYFGKDTANILLDFYIWNCTLAADGYKVKADITAAANEATSVTLDKWAPKFIQNLGMGKSKIELTLMDKDGKQVEGPHTSGSREFTLAAQEQAK